MREDGGKPRKLTRPKSPNLMTDKRVKVMNQFDDEMTVETSANLTGVFKARPLNQTIMQKPSKLPQVEKRGKTDFDEFRLS